jgi:hypothetical protein
LRVGEFRERVGEPLRDAGMQALRQCTRRRRDLPPRFIVSFLRHAVSILPRRR